MVNGQPQDRAEITEREPSDSAREDRGDFLEFREILVRDILLAYQIPAELLQAAEFGSLQESSGHGRK